MDYLRKSLLNLNPAELRELIYCAAFMRDRRAVRATAEVDDNLASSLRRQAEFFSALTIFLHDAERSERSFSAHLAAELNPGVKASPAIIESDSDESFELSAYSL